jgi:cytochrome c biogenesis protein CcmG, thiol:disulfide interchange protein DsbE
MTAVLIVLAAGLPERGRSNALLPIGPRETPVAPEVGALAPPIEIQSLKGTHFSLAALRGNAVIVNFWATWCGPCIAETPMLQAVYESFRVDGLSVIGIDVRESPTEVIEWQAKFGITYDLVIDRDERLNNLYQVRGLPTTYFIGRDGIIRDIVRGPLDRSGLESRVRNLLGK